VVTVLFQVMRENSKRLEKKRTPPPETKGFRGGGFRQMGE
jgi:hypothetical protein